MALAPTSRRSTAAAIASALAAMALAAAVAGRSCRVSQPGPEATVRDMLQAAKSGDHETVYELLGPSTHAALEAEARQSTNLVGASVRFTAMSLVSVGSSEGIAPPTDVTVVEERGDSAIVELVSPAGRARLALVRVGGHWRIELPEYSR